MAVSLNTGKLWNSTLQLLLVNRQFHDEFKKILPIKITNQPACHVVNILFAKQCGLWHTWTLVPFLTRHVETLMAKFHVIEPDEAIVATYKKKTLFHSERRGRPMFHWSLYYLLSSFFEVSSYFYFFQVLLEVPRPDPTVLFYSSIPTMSGKRLFISTATWS